VWTLGAVCIFFAMTKPDVAAPAPELLAVSFASPQNGWVAGNGVIFSTNDGGKHWSRQYSGRARLSALDFVDSRNGWAAGMDPISGTGVLLGTSDGGAHWTKLTDTPHPLRSLSFADPQDGIGISGGSLARLAIGEWGETPFIGGKIAITHDGGHSWTLLDTPQSADTTCYGDALHAWTGNQASVQRTVDGGKTWHHVLAAQVDPYRTWAARVSCSGPDAAWVAFETTDPIVAQSGRPFVLYRTTDGGATWQPVLENAGAAAAYRLVSAPAASLMALGPFGVAGQNDALLLGFRPTDIVQGSGVSAQTTADGGTAWQALNAIGGLSVMGAIAISVVDPQHVWVAGSSAHGSHLYATADGGHSWTEQFPR